MQAWVSVSAGRRGPTLDPIACCRLHPRRLVLSRCVYIGVDCTVGPSRPHCIRNDHSRSRHLPFSQTIRNFFATSPARIVLEEEDEERNELTALNGAVGRSERPNPNRNRILPSDMRTLILSREVKNSQPRYLRRLDPGKLRKIEQQASLMGNPHELVDQFLDVKHARLVSSVLKGASLCKTWQIDSDKILSDIVARLEIQIQNTQAANKLIEHEYCKIAFRGIPALQKATSQLARTIWKTQYAFFVTILHDSQAFISNMQRLLEQDYLEPRQSARANIDRLINSSVDILQRYQSLRAVGTKVMNGILEIRFFCADIERTFWVIDPGLDDIIEGLKYHTQDFSQYAHAFRADWFIGQRRLHPLTAGELWNWRDFKARLRFEDCQSRENMQIIQAIVLKEKVAQRRLIDKHQHLVTQRIRMLYTRRWNGPLPPESPLLDRFWRQLDAMAPMEIHATLLWRMSLEIMLLGSSLQGKFGPMWEQVAPWNKRKHWEAISRWLRVFRLQRADFLDEMMTYRQVNWTRLGVEEKLHSLGEPNMFEEEKLFLAPNPLSQSYTLFRDWLQKITTIGFEAWYLQKAINLAADDTALTFWPQLTAKYKEELRRPFKIPALGFERVKKNRRRSKHTASASKSNQKTRLPGKIPRNRDTHPSPFHSTKPTHESLGDRNPMRAGERSAAPLNKKSTSLRKPTNSRSHAAARVRRKKLSADRAALKDPGHKVSTSNHTASTQKPSKSAVAHAVTATASHGPWVTKKFFISRPLSKKGRPYSTSSMKTSNYRDESSHDRLPTPVVTDTSKLARDCIQSTEDTNPSAQKASPEIKPAVNKVTTPLYWNHNLQRGPDGQKLIVHYCRSLESTEEVARYFLGSKVIGFDMEWKVQASASDSIQNNLSLIQIANEKRIALFQIALFKPARTLQDLVAPSLKQLLESAEITKVGVAIKADSTRLRKYLGIDARSIFELSHLYKVIKYGHSEPKLVNKRAVNLSDQMQEHFGLPLEKSEDVRCSDWTRALTYSQVQYAATDPYACLCLFNIMEQKRQTMNPVPPRPAHAELNLPIILPHGESMNPEDEALTPPDSIVSELDRS